MHSKRKSANSSIPLNQIHIDDAFFNKYVRLVKEAIVPYQWDVLNDRLEDVETSHCIENFKIAAGDSEGEFKGAVFQDTDVAKWLEAVAFVLSMERDEALEALADGAIDLIGRAQHPDGYINTYFTIKEPNARWSNLVEGHELYVAGHLIEAAVAYYEATGKDKFLKIMCRFADLICDTFGTEEGQIHGYPGHQEIELALVKLYRTTGERKYLDQASYFIEARGCGDNYFLEEMKRDNYKNIFPEFLPYDTKYSQSHMPVRQQMTAEGHAVRAVYMYCAMADLAYEYEDEELMQCCETLWHSITSKRMYITGSIGSSGLLERFTTDYDLPNDCNYSETCASIGLAGFGKRMADINKDASYMDVVERALYNTVLSGIAMDGKSFFYVNPLEVWPDSCIERTSKEHVKPVRQKWFGVACCPPNIARTLASLGQYIYFNDEDRLYVNLYIANQTKLTLNDVPVTVELKGTYPWKNQMDVKVTASKEVNASLAFRIPGYVKKARFYRNGNEITDYSIEKGYAVVEGCFYEDDLSIVFDMVPEFVHANPLVRADAGKTAVVKGPLVYCLEEVDNGSNLASVFVDTDCELLEEFDEDTLGGVSIIKFKGKKISAGEWNENTLYKTGKVDYQDIDLKAIPYCYWNNRVPGEMVVWMKELF